MSNRRMLSVPQALFPSSSTLPTLQVNTVAPDRCARNSRNSWTSWRLIRLTKGGRFAKLPRKYSRVQPPTSSLAFDTLFASFLLYPFEFTLCRCLTTYTFSLFSLQSRFVANLSIFFFRFIFVKFHSSSLASYLLFLQASSRLQQRTREYNKSPKLNRNFDLFHFSVPAVTQLVHISDNCRPSGNASQD